MTPRVNVELATRFNIIYGNRNSTRQDLEEIYKEVFAATELMPDMPERFVEKKVEVKRWSLWPQKGLNIGAIEE